MDFAGLNWWAIISSMIFTVISGAIWFGPKTFYPIWFKAAGRSQKDMESSGMNMGTVFGLTFLSAFIQPFIFSVIFQHVYPDGASLAEGLFLGFLIWFAFVGSTSLVNRLFGYYPISVWLIETGNHLINYLVFGILFSILK